jgi:predicted outer membrane repeat protein
MKNINHSLKCLAALVAGLMLGLMPARAVDFHVATAQDLQNALTLAAANGADDVIYLAAGYYIGNFNYNSAEAASLTLQGEAGTTNTQITVDGAGTGRTMNLSSSANAAMTVRGITFLRNCGSTSNAGLRISTGNAADVLVEDCRFISPSGTSGMGLELASGHYATVCRCTAAGVYSSGCGISITGLSAKAMVRDCLVVSNSSSGLVVQNVTDVLVTNNTFAGNWGDAGAYLLGNSAMTFTVCNNNFNRNFGHGVHCSAGGSWVTTTAMLAGNTFTGNGIIGGYGALCSGARFSGMAATLSGNTLVGNSQGGAVISAPEDGGASATLSCNTFTSNSGYGGVCCGCNYAVTFIGNVFTGNSCYGYSYHGGGAYCQGSTLTLSNNTFTGNSTPGPYGGGGIRCVSLGGAVTFFGNIFTANSASAGPGGGVYCSGGPLTAFGNVFKQNSAAQSGGGLYVDGSSVVLLDNLVVKNGQAGSSYKGGGIWVRASALDMINNTVFANTAAGSGGGVAFQVDGVSEILHVYNNIIWGNSASGNGADVHLAGTGSRKEFLYNDVNGMYGVWDIAQNLLNVDPQFFDAVNGDYHIQSTSPCKDAGTNGAPSLPATDLDDGPRIANGTVDLGCYEFSTAATHPADTNADFVIASDEFNAYAAAWKASQAWTNGPNPGPSPIPADYTTRAGYLMTNGGAYHNDGSARPVNWKTGP